MMRTRDRLRRALSGLALLGGCTLSTGASDRQVVENLDFNFTMQGFSAHQRTPVEVALVTLNPGPDGGVPPIPGAAAQDSKTNKYLIRGRVRVLMPPEVAGQPYPDVSVRLANFIGDDYFGRAPLRVLFYADSDLSDTPDPLDATGNRLEHTWIRDLPGNGELSFAHAANFQNFFDDEIASNGADVVLDVPALEGHPARAACLDAQLGMLMKKSFEVRIIFNPDTASQTCGFKMHVGNTLPLKPIRFKGLSDVLTTYAVQRVVDGVADKGSLTPMAPASGLVIPFEQWFPVAPAAIAACLAMP
ncbi:MAG: hypothetical protein JWN48_2638 [Myxococcaceae bacterium]|nr:hypothetical protein [Myxococcaceae bacterium]